MTTVLVCGSRGWTDYDLIRRVLEGYDPETVVVNGANGTWDKRVSRWVGADKISTVVAWGLGLEVREYPADWRRYGRAAGPKRNGQMLADEEIDEVVAFRLPGKSDGTDDMCRQAREAGVPVTVYDPEGLHTDLDRGCA